MGLIRSSLFLFTNQSQIRLLFEENSSHPCALHSNNLVGFKMIRNLIISVLFLLSSSQVNAAASWGLKGNYIEAVAVFWDGYNNVIAITMTNPVSTGCAVTDANKTVHYWIRGATFDSSVNTWLSTALAAQAQGKKVELLLDNVVCDQYYGKSLLGIKVFTK